MVEKRMFCFLGSVISMISSFVFGGYRVSGHDYRLIYENDQIEVCKCEICGKDSISYKNRYLVQDWVWMNKGE